MSVEAISWALNLAPIPAIATTNRSAGARSCPSAWPTNADPDGSRDALTI
jgi:hypothetical protein